MTEMCVSGTPLEHHPALGLWVKREDMSCPEGPHFSKTRGVWARVQGRNEAWIGVLDTSHSQGGWAVARACHLLGRRCVLYYPVRKAEQGAPLKPQQQAALDLGAELVPLQAGRSAVLYHTARRLTEEREGYMMPNALKLTESVEETSREVQRTRLPGVRTVLVSASSGTLAAGVIKGLLVEGWSGEVVVHLGYSRPPGAALAYVEGMVGEPSSEGWFGRKQVRVSLVDEGYSYADSAKAGETPPFPCNEYYDLKALRWWQRDGRAQHGEALLWNIG